MSRIIVFLIPPKKEVNGGILSIFSLCKESRRFKDIHDSEVLIATYPGEESYPKNDLFDNNETIHSFDSIVKKFPKPQSLILHMPEYAVSYLRKKLIKNYKAYLDPIPDLQINILNQNIELMPPVLDVIQLLSISPNITQTTAHKRYANQQTCDSYSIPTHLMSVSLDPSQYNFTSYEQKENLIVISPDKSPHKDSIVEKLSKELPSYSIIEVNDMTFDQYKDLISRAKFTITFGEGFDGYLIESTFSGGIAFAVYNDQFFPSSDYKQLDNIYTSHKDMFDKIVSRIKTMDNENIFLGVNNKTFLKLSKIYNFKDYLRNIERFYMKDYSFKPVSGSREKALTTALEQKEKKSELELKEKDTKIRELEKYIANQTAQLTSSAALIKHKDQLIDGMTHSLSWKLTKPLREINVLLHK